MIHMTTHTESTATKTIPTAEHAYRAATPMETYRYLHGDARFPGSRETDHGLAIPVPDEVVSVIIDNLPERVDLCYVDYRDSLSTDQVRSIVEDPEDGTNEVMDYLHEAWDEDRHVTTMNIMEETVRDLFGDEAEGILEILYDESDLGDEVRWAIQDRDESDILSDLLRHTPDITLRYDLHVEAPGWDATEEDVEEAIDDILSALDIDTEETDQGETIATGAETDQGGEDRQGGENSQGDARTIIRDMLAEVSYSGTPVYVIFRADLGDLLAAKWKGETTTMTFDRPFLVALNGMNGSGMDSARIPATVSLPFDWDRLRLDARGGHGYSWTEDVAGTIPGAYDTQITLT